MVVYVCVVDFEATCWKTSNHHEIIEFPSVMLKWDDGIVEIDRFQQYVRPKIKPIVSQFCEKLTGITQHVVDNGVDLKNTVADHLSWIRRLAGDNMVVVLTCGSWDIEIMLPMDFQNNNIVINPIYQQYVDLKDLFKTTTNKKGSSMLKMLEYYGLRLEGRHHSGIDDCYNISKIFIQMVKDGLTEETFKQHILQQSD
jgi:inhibitor of KinA sporulation pathway (predicted exonuclease)